MTGLQFRVSIIFFLFLFVNTLFAQNIIVLSDSSVLKIKGVEKNILKLKTSSVKNYNKHYISLERKLVRAGFVAVQIDSTSNKQGGLLISVETGKKISMLEIEIDSATKELLNQYRIKPIKSNSTFNAKAFYIFREHCIKELENNGYPFATFKTSGNIDSKNKITTLLSLQKNNLIKYDSIEVKGDANISKEFLIAYLNVPPKGIYKEKDIKQFEKKLNQLEFLNQIKSPDIVFTETKAKSLLYINARKNNQVDGLIGFLPDETTGKILFTGQAHIKLLNALNYGELIDVNWRKLQAKTQDLKLQFNMHHLFKTPLGFESSIKIYNRDTLFQDVTPSLGLQYYFSGLNHVKLFVNRRSSSLNSTRGYETITTLPDYADVSSTLYGIGFKIDEVDYATNPRKGIRFSSNIAAGSKEISQNPRINPEAYKGLDLKTSQYTFDLSADYFWNIYKQHVINIGTDFASIQAKQVMTNELFRLGGLYTLRGFDDESIFASSYSVSTLEYRFLFEKNSYLYAFTDWCWYEENSKNKYINDIPKSFGTGIRFETKAGLFNINYALGKQFNNPILLRAAKIHFGFSSYF